MRRQNFPGALCNRENRRHNLASTRMAEGFTVCGAIPLNNERRYGACSIPCRTHWRNDHARPRALDKLVYLAVGASRAGHRHPHLGLDAAAASRASAEAALTPHFRRRRAQTGSVEAPPPPLSGIASRTAHLHSLNGIRRIQSRRLSGDCPRLPSQILTILSPLVIFLPTPSEFTSSAS